MRGAAIGALLALASFVVFPSWLGLFERRPLSIATLPPETTSGPHPDPGSSRAPSHLDGTRYPGLAPVKPGLHDLQWRRRFKAYEERVGSSQLVGPFQDPANPPCSAYLMFGNLSFSGQAGRTSLTDMLAERLDASLKGRSFWPLGDYKGVRKIELAIVPWKPGSKAAAELLSRLGGEETIKAGGFIRASVAIGFKRATIPIRVHVLPYIDEGTLELKSIVRARLELESPLYRLVSRVIDGDDIVSEAIDDELERVLQGLISKPPPMPLPGGHSLELSFCRDRPITIAGKSLAIPLSAHVAGGSGQSILPPLASQKLGPPPPKDGRDIAIALSDNALLALVHALWASGTLDKELGPQLARAFNEHETVQRFLRLRLEEVSFPLPPSVHIEGETARMNIALRFVVRDGKAATEATAFVTIGTELRRVSLAKGKAKLVLGDLRLSCQDHDGSLRTCYGAILSQLAAQQDLLGEALSTVVLDSARRVFLGAPLTQGIIVEDAAVMPSPVGVDLEIKLERTKNQ